jgi:tetratricopeptide (TPR) repeat protein
MKKKIGIIALFGLLAVSGISYAEYVPEDIDPEAYNEIETDCWAAERKMDIQEIVNCHKDLADWHKKKGKYDIAYYEIEQAGYYCTMDRDYKNAIKYTLESIDGFKKIGNKEGEADGYRQLGYIYKEKGDKKKAKEYYMKAYELYKSIGAEEDAQNTLKAMMGKARY